KRRITECRGLGTGSGRGFLCGTAFPLAARSGTIKATSLGRTTMTIAAVLRGKGSAIESIPANATLFDAVRKLGEKRIGALPVVEGGRISGIVSERDVIYCLRDHGPEVLDWPVS